MKMRMVASVQLIEIDMKLRKPMSLSLYAVPFVLCYVVSFAQPSKYLGRPTTRPSSSPVYTFCAKGSIQVMAELMLYPAGSR